MPGNQLFDQSLHAEPGQRVQCNEGLVEQQQMRLLHQRARQRDTLRLAAGQVTRPFLQPIAESDLAQRNPREALALLVRQAECDIAPERIPRQQAMLLEHHRRARGHGDPSAIHPVQPGDGAQQRGLAAATLPQQGNELATLDAQIEAADDRARAIGSRQLVDNDGRQIGVLGSHPRAPGA